MGFKAVDKAPDEPKPPANYRGVHRGARQKIKATAPVPVDNKTKKISARDASGGEDMNWSYGAGGPVPPSRR